MGNRLIEVSWHDAPVHIPDLALSLYNRETGFTCYCADHLREIGQADFWHHSANENRGSGLHAIRAGRMAKRMGQSKGFPDFVAPSANGGLAIELKIATSQEEANKKLSADQVKWLQHFKNIGWKVYVIWRFKDFVSVVEKHTCHTPAK